GRSGAVLPAEDDIHLQGGVDEVRVFRRRRRGRQVVEVDGAIAARRRGGEVVVVNGGEKQLRVRLQREPRGGRVCRAPRDSRRDRVLAPEQVRTGGGPRRDVARLARGPPKRRLELQVELGQGVESDRSAEVEIPAIEQALALAVQVDDDGAGGVGRQVRLE